MSIQTVNPATGEVVETFDALDADGVEDRLSRAAAAAQVQRRSPMAERRRRMEAAADLLDAEQDAAAAMMTLEMGKPIAAARAEAAKCARGMRYYAEHAEVFLAPEALDDPSEVGATRAYRRYDPLGVVLAVMPWNFPLWQVVRFAAPALMAGNVGLLKHASNVPRTALYLEDLFRRAGFGDAFQTLLVGSAEVEQVLRDPRVAAATVTGSEGAGRAVASVCGDEIKKTVLELGGSDAFVVMPSADLEDAVTTAVTARSQNNGQSCIAAKRFIVHADVYDGFLERFVAGTEALVVGDPSDEATDVGPLATEQGRDDLAELVADAVAGGARVCCGGRAPDRPGWFYEPTVLVGVTTGMRIYREEAFGPVAVVYRVAALDEAIDLANTTDFGLSSSAWSSDPEEQERLAVELQAGAVFLNGMSVSHPQLPFGGIKRSGYGRELADVGIREFCNTKTVWVR